MKFAVSSYPKLIRARCLAAALFLASLLPAAAQQAIGWGKYAHFDMTLLRVTAWYSNSVPANWTNVAAFACALNNEAAVFADGTVGVYGDTSWEVTNVPPSATNVVGIACGEWHFLALRADGRVVAWGDNWNGQCSVPASLTNARLVAAGSYFSAAVRQNGQVRMWGDNGHNQLTNAPLALTNATTLVCGYAHTLALLDDGTIAAWGDNTYHQTEVPAEATNVVAVAACMNHSLALRADGTVLGWGASDGGVVPVPDNLTNAVAIATGQAHGIALLNDQTVAAWGTNDEGQLNVPAGLSGVGAVYAGGRMSVVVTNAAVVTIRSQPASVLVNGGTTATFAISASGTSPVQYQWQFNGDPLPGQTGAALTLSSVNVSNVGVYDVVVSSLGGSVTSQVATLSVWAQDLHLIRETQTGAAEGTADSRLEFSGLPGLQALVDWSPDFIQWKPLTNFVLISNLGSVTDPGVAGQSQRFYRVRLTP